MLAQSGLQVLTVCVIVYVMNVKRGFEAKVNTCWYVRPTAWVEMLNARYAVRLPWRNTFKGWYEGSMFPWNVGIPTYVYTASQPRLPQSTCLSRWEGTSFLGVLCTECMKSWSYGVGVKLAPPPSYWIIILNVCVIMGSRRNVEFYGLTESISWSRLYACNYVKWVIGSRHLMFYTDKRA